MSNVSVGVFCLVLIIVNLFLTHMGIPYLFILSYFFFSLFIHVLFCFYIIIFIPYFNFHVVSSVTLGLIICTFSTFDFSF